jgi:coenzyme F420-reducing hydrogenase beta subunit
MVEYITKNDETLCCGCRACEQVCPANAITMEFNDEGFLYPKLNETLCTKCKKCQISCPINNDAADKKKGFETPITFAAWSNNQKIRIESSSGGLFSTIAEYVFSKGGIVFGAAFDENLTLSYKSASNANELEPLKVSKYIQANPCKSFTNVRSLLKKNVLVFFVGTPCYVAGLKMFLRKDYENLITADFSCHGVPSQKLFNKYISHLKKKYKGEIVKFRFRDKTDWGGQRPNTSFYVRKSNAKEKRKSIPLSLTSYFFSFLNYRTHRPSCYECQFRSVRRISDFTLADYWGIENFHSNMDFNKGVSALIIHSNKGKDIIEKLGNKISKVDSKIEYAIRYNVNMFKKSKKHPWRDEIYKNIDKLTYAELDKRYFRPDNYFKIVVLLAVIKFKMSLKAMALRALRKN